MEETPKDGVRTTERRRQGSPASAMSLVGRDVRKTFGEYEYEGLRALLLQAPSPILMMTGPEHPLSFVNPPSLSLLGHRAVEDLLGRPVREAAPEMAGTGFFEMLDAVYESGRAPSELSGGLGGELPGGLTGEPGRDGSKTRLGFARSGTTPGRRSYFDLLYQPLRGPAGDVVGVMVQATDVTLLAEARMEAEKREALLARQWAEINAIYGTAPIGLALVDAASLRFMRANRRQAELAGMEVTGQTVTEAFPFIDGIGAAFRRAAGGEMVLNHVLEGKLSMESAVECCWRLSATPVRGSDGSVDAITVVMQDTTAERRIAAVLLETEKLVAVGRLASSIAHEINNPLESVVNLVYLASRCESLHEVKEYLAQADLELLRAANVTTQTLRFHKQLTNAQKVSCGELFAAALSVYKGRFQNCGIVVEKRKRAQETVVCMEGEIQQVLATLLSNAVDAMARGGRLQLRSRDATDWRTGRKGLYLTVADNGTGMSRATQQRIFEAFFSTKGIGGSGLGLWVSKEAVERHDGRIRVRSSEGPIWHGTVCEVFLPYQIAEHVRNSGSRGAVAVKA